MKIAFDLNAVLKNPCSGFYTYGTNLLRGLANLQNCPEIKLFCENKYASTASDLFNPTRTNLSLKTTRIKLRHLQNLWKFINTPALQIFTGQFDIFHSFHNLMPPAKNKKRLLTVHDLRRYMLPELYRKSRLDSFEYAVKNADHYIAVSQSTKDDLCRIFNICPEKIDVTHLACDPALKPLSQNEKSKTKELLAQKYNCPLDKYLVCFSSPDARKNIPRTINAFNRALPDLPEDTKLLVIGAPPKNDPDFVNSANENKSVIFTGPIDSVKQILGSADAMIFASLYEGFGLPILEAFSMHLPVITSNSSSMSEVAADAALLINPQDIDSICAAITKLYTDPAITQKLIESGKERLKSFSWQNTANKTLDVYKKLTN